MESASDNDDPSVEADKSEKTENQKEVEEDPVCIPESQVSTELVRSKRIISQLY